MKKNKGAFQNFSKSLLFPISMLSFMAIFLGLAAALQNPNIIKYVPFLKNEILQNIFGGIRKLAGIPFGYLPIMFAMAIPLSMVKRDKEVAVYSAVVGYIAMLVGMNYVLGLQGLTPDTTSVDALVSAGKDQAEAVLFNSQFTNTLGIFVFNTNVIGGLLAGIVTIFVHNRFRNTELHESLTFYSGKRFVPIINTIIMLFVGVLLTFIWPLINNLIMEAGRMISNAGSAGSFLYGFTEKIINPTGLHHILNQTFRFTALGGMETIDGNNLVGSLNIFLYQLEHNLPFSPQATQYLAQGKILHMVFGMPAAVFAIVKCAKPEFRRKVFNYFLAGLTAVILTGITEPIEFTFIFISPILWIMNAVFAGLAFLVPSLLNVTIGNVQGGIIDWFVFGVLQGTATKWYIYLIAGPLFFAMYYFAYKFVIEKFNVLTIGRQDGDFNVVAEYDDDINMNIEDEKLAEIVVEGLGGLDNIVGIDNCISRLRVEVKDSSLANEDLFRKTGSKGLIIPDDKSIHVVYGGKVTKMRNIVDDYYYSKKGNK
ncbi:PTS transporter subunit EIIC [Helcococcus kunzii]|uniref:PTS transporter subunit EIIC n=1 Tax=Helcococcus kunzii TaxID=40091 RepID=UPI0024AE65B8|nr:PTS transporter subunit EIIC [Helcococcus kunzii]